MNASAVQLPGLQLTGLAPLLDARCRVVILGSFPGRASLAAQQYYGHPQNHFWRILRDIFSPGMDLPADYALKTAWLLDHGLGLWDVYAACTREGSLDSAIRDARTNDLMALRERCPDLRAIAHNGGESYKHRRHTEALGLPVHRLPSTSPANAGVPYARKLDAWRQALTLYL